jgi:hypothetical protein
MDEMDEMGEMKQALTVNKCRLEIHYLFYALHP